MGNDGDISDSAHRDFLISFCWLAASLTMHWPRGILPGSVFVDGCEVCGLIYIYEAICHGIENGFVRVRVIARMQVLARGNRKMGGRNHSLVARAAVERSIPVYQRT